MTRIHEIIRHGLRWAHRPSRRFARDERASLSVEAVLIAPLLFWTFIATYTYFDVYRVRNVAMKANYAVSDLLSRETQVIDMNYITGAKNLYRYLTQTDSSSWVRVSVVYCESDCAVSPGATSADRTLNVDWSKSTDDMPTYTQDDVNDYLDQYVPLLAAEERVIVVETHMDYDAPFASSLTGLTVDSFYDIVMTSPRFGGGQLCFDGIGCGLGG